MDWVRTKLELLVAIILVAVFTAIEIADPSPATWLRLAVFDEFQKQSPRPVPAVEDQPVVIVDIDEASLAEFGQWPWPRTIIAQMVEKLFQAGVVVVAFSATFPEADRTNPANFAQTTGGLDEETRRRLEVLPDNDSALAEVIGRRRVVLGLMVSKTQNAGAINSAIGPIAYQGDPRAFIPTFPAVIGNMDILANAADGQGVISLPFDHRRLFRRVPMVMVLNDTLHPAMTLEMLRVGFGTPVLVSTDEGLGVTRIAIGKKLKFPTDRHGRVWPYFTQSDSSRYLPARNVLGDIFEPSRLKGRLAIIGTTAVGLSSMGATPADSLVPMVEVHAQTIESMLGGTLLGRPAHSDAIEFLVIIIGGLISAYLLTRVPWRWTLPLGVVLAGVAVTASWYAFRAHLALIDCSPLTVLVVTQFFLIGVIRQFQSAR